MSLPIPLGSRALCVIVAATLSGGVSAVLLEPAMHLIERVPLFSNNIVGALSPFALTAGLAFGVCGGIVARFAIGLRTADAVVFWLASMFGMAAAVYVAMSSFDNTTNSFVVPYTLSSPLGALILAVPFAVVGRFAQPWRTIGLATVLPTLWAVGVAAVLSSEDALAVPGLAALYIGWQAIFLGVFAVARRTYRPHIPLG